MRLCHPSSSFDELQMIGQVYRTNKANKTDHADNTATSTVASDALLIASDDK